MNNTKIFYRHHNLHHKHQGFTKFKKQRKPIDIEEVEPIEEILKVQAEYVSGISAEAHETLAMGMNRIKGASCSGEEES